MSNLFKGIVKLTQEQFNTLKDQGIITVNNKTISYDPVTTLYLTPDTTEAELEALNTSLEVLNTSLEALNISLEGKQDTLIPGDGLEIENNTIKLTSAAPFVSYTEEQTLSEEQKALVRNTIGAASASGTTEVKYAEVTGKPILDTSLETTLATDTNETINGTVKLHKVSKTGLLADLITDTMHTTISTAEKQQISTNSINIDSLTEELEAFMTQVETDKADRSEIPTIDTELSIDSTNPVQNKAITEVMAVFEQAIMNNEDSIKNINTNKADKTAVTEEINSAISAVVDSAPEAFDTLKEISDWIAEDEAGTSALINRVSTAESDIVTLQTNIQNYLPLAGGTMSGSIILPNAIYLQVKDSSAVAHPLIGMDGSNQILIGESGTKGLVLGDGIVRPFAAGASLVDLGTDTQKFKSLYLSEGVNAATGTFTGNVTVLAPAATDDSTNVPTTAWVNSSFLKGDLYLRTANGHQNDNGQWDGYTYYHYNKSNSLSVTDSLLFNDDFEVEQTSYDSATSGMDLTVKSKAASYDLVIRTQADFEAFCNNLNNITAKSVLFVGDGGTLEFTLSTSTGLVLPQSLYVLKGVNNAIINITHSSSDNSAAIHYETNPDFNHTIEDITLKVNSGVSLGRAKGFEYCNNLKNCVAIVNGIYTSSISTTSYGYAYGFSSCNNLINCRATVIGKASTDISTGYAFGFFDCSGLINCVADSTATRRSYGFTNCKKLFNCISSAKSTGDYETPDVQDFFNCTDVPIQFNTDNDLVSDEANASNYFIRHSNGILEIHMGVQQTKGTTVTYSFPYPFKTDTKPKCFRSAEYSGSANMSAYKNITFNSITNTDFTIYCIDTSAGGDNLMINAYGYWE